MSKLGIFYTDNAFPKILNLSLEKLKLSSKGVRIITCVNSHIENNPFEEIIVNNPIRNHYNIIQKILTGIEHAKNTGNYKYVSFLEHDVLYPEGYFDYPEFSESAMNENYIGICSVGFQKRNQCQNVLHQTTMELEFAIKHFKNLEPKSRRMGVELEPNIKTKFNTLNPSVHINHGRNFTNHYDCYDRVSTVGENEYWGNYSDLWEKI